MNPYSLYIVPPFKFRSQIQIETTQNHMDDLQMTFRFRSQIQIGMVIDGIQTPTRHTDANTTYFIHVTMGLNKFQQITHRTTIQFGITDPN